MLLRNALVAVALGSLAGAGATPSRPQAAAAEPRILTYDDVVLPRADGGYDVMKRWQWSDLERRLQKEERRRAAEHKRAALAGETIPAWANLDVGGAASGGLRLGRRDCEQSSEVQVLTDTNFTDADVAMSPVIGGLGGQATVAVTKGYSVANSLTVGVSQELTFVKDLFKMSMKIDYGTTWTSTDSQTFTYWVSPGQYGVVVSNPYTRRLTGNVLSGCTDAPSATAFTADSRSSQTYTDLSWVSGPIYLCNSTTYPVPYCVGEGSHT